MNILSQAVATPRKKPNDLHGVATTRLRTTGLISRP